jgi:hypothetical protein
MTCDETRRRLTAYLDGDLDADGGTLVRVHLRGCEACRQVATDEATLRDDLRALPTLDPPASLWAGVQARLAVAEEAEARRPRWRRALARWAPQVPRLATGGLVAAAAVGAVWWRTNHAGDPGPEPTPSPLRVVANPPPELEPSPAPSPAATELARSCNLPEAGDVTADLALDDARRSGCYAAAARELLARSGEIRAQWTGDQQAAFDARVASLREAVAEADEGKPRHRAWRSMVRYLQNALVRDEVVAVASGGVP